MEFFLRALLTRTYHQVKVHKFVIHTAIPPIFIQDVSYMYINTSFKYHRVTCTQSCVITKVHDLLGQPSYINIERLNSVVLCVKTVQYFYMYFGEKNTYLISKHTCQLSPYLCKCVVVYAPNPYSYMH